MTIENEGMKKLLLLQPSVDETIKVIMIYKMIESESKDSRIEEVELRVRNKE